MEVLLDFFYRMRPSIVRGVSGQSYWREKKKKKKKKSRFNLNNLPIWSEPLKSVDRTLLFLHFHHLPLPLVKSGDVLGVFAARSGVCVGADRGAQVLSQIMREWELEHLLWQRGGKNEKKTHSSSDRLTCSFSMCDALASRCLLLGGLGGGATSALVPVVCALEVFSSTIGGLLREPKPAFITP